MHTPTTSGVSFIQIQGVARRRGWHLEGVSTRRLILEPSRKPIKYLKGIETDQGFEEVAEEEIIKGYEHAKGHHVLIEPRELDDLKLEAKHTIDMARFVDLDQIDTRYFEKPYYLLPDGDQADEGYTVLRDALARTRKAAVGQLIMHGREHLVGITAHGNGLMLVILRYPHELRDAEPYFQKIDGKVDTQAVKLAVDLIEQSSGRFEPEKMPNEYARAVHELVQAKIEQRAPEVEIETAKGETPKVINIMDALKKSMHAKGQAKVKDVVRKRMGNAAPKRVAQPTATKARSGSRRSLH